MSVDLGAKTQISTRSGDSGGVPRGSILSPVMEIKLGRGGRRREGERERGRKEGGRERVEGEEGKKRWGEKWRGKRGRKGEKGLEGKRGE